MNCPQCNAPIKQKSPYCDVCGYHYEDEIYNQLSIYFDLRKEVDDLNNLKNSFQIILDRVIGKLRNFEGILTTQLKKLAELIAGQKEMESKQIAEAKIAEQPAPILQPKEKIPTEPVISSSLKTEISPVNAEKSAKQEDKSGFELRLGQKWMLIIGIVTMVFGIGYFLKYSFEQGWVGPAGRVTMTYLWGMIFLIGGNKFRQKNFKIFGLYLIGGGIATLYFSTFAAYQIYHLFNSISSFSLMILTTVLACILAIKYDTKWLAVLGLIGGFSTPVLLSTGTDNQIALMLYMTILNLGLLSIAFYKKWNVLNGLGFTFTYILYASWFGAHYSANKFWPAVIFLNIFYLIYILIPFAQLIKKENEGSLKSLLSIMSLDSFIAFGFNFFMIKQYFSAQWVSVIAISYALIFLVLATFLPKTDRQKQPSFVLLLGEAILFLVIAVPIIFSQHWITIFWSAQALTLLWMGLRLDIKNLIYSAYILLFASIFKFLVYDYSIVFKFSLDTFSLRHSYTYLIFERYLTVAFVLAILYKFGQMIKKARPKSLPPDQPLPTSAVFIFWGILLFIILNIETGAFFYQILPEGRLAMISILWTLFAVPLIVKGFKDNNSALRKTAFVLLIITVFKFLFYDYPLVFQLSMGFHLQYLHLPVVRYLVSLLLLAVFFVFAINSKKLLAQTERSKDSYLANESLSLFAIFGILLFIILNIEVSSFFFVFLPMARFAAISVLWSLFSIMLMIKGFKKNSLALRKISLGLFLITLIKVFLFDVARFSTPYRIVSFIILGLVLIGTSYLYYKFKDKIAGKEE